MKASKERSRTAGASGIQTVFEPSIVNGPVKGDLEAPRFLAWRKWLVIRVEIRSAVGYAKGRAPLPEMKTALAYLLSCLRRCYGCLFVNWHSGIFFILISMNVLLLAMSWRPG